MVAIDRVAISIIWKLRANSAFVSVAPRQLRISKRSRTKVKSQRIHTSKNSLHRIIENLNKFRN